MKKFFVVLTVLFFTVFTAASFSFASWESFDYYGSHGGSDEATEYQNILASDKVSADVVNTSNAVTYRDAAGRETLPDQPKTSVGAEAGIKKNVKTFTLPLSYGLPVGLLGTTRDFLNFSLKVPYTKRKMGGVRDNGLGDIRLSADYLAKFPNLLFNTVFLIKFATGDFDDADVPLGTGSTDYGLAFNGKWYFDGFALTGGLGYVLTGDFSKSGSKVSYGDEIVVSAGGEYNINETMFAGAEFIYNIKEEKDFTDQFGNFKYAGLNTFDFIPSFTYFFKKYGLEMTAKVVIPVADSWNGGDNKPADPDRGMEFKFQITRPF